jgi:hypothetical protein
MILLDKADYTWITDDEELWQDADQSHVISREGDGWYIRDESGELGAYPSLAAALDYLQVSQVWGPVELGPARRLRRNVTEGRADEVAQFLLEYLAEYGTVGIDVRDLAENVLTLQEG